MIIIIYLKSCCYNNNYHKSVDAAMVSRQENAPRFDNRMVLSTDIR